MVFVDPREPVEAIQDHVREFGFPGLPVRDPGHLLVAWTGATITPEAAVFTPSGVMKYRGRINDLYIDFGKARSTPTCYDLDRAIEAALKSKPVSEPHPAAIGCYISDLQVNYESDIAPIINDKCASCHQPGDAAPFPLIKYGDVRRRAGQIADVTDSGFMPPWLPKAGFGDFLGDRRLTTRERELIQHWVQAGAPQGEVRSQPRRPLNSEWQLGEPDLVLETDLYELPTTGSDQFRNFTVSAPIDRPRWVRAAELRPINLRVTHHARLGVDPSLESRRRDEADPAPGYDGMAWGQDPDGQLVTWVPGMRAVPGIPDAAWRLIPDACLVFHAHLQPSGKPESVQFRLALYFADEAPQVRPVVLRLGTQDIDIPAGERRHEVTDEWTLPANVIAHSIFPHAHALCQEVQVEARTPDDSTIPLIWIERFDENWHDVYRYREPLRLSRGTRIISRFRYDNSADNPRNRHVPPKRVTFGSHADDEMADVYLQLVLERPDERAMFLEEYQLHSRRVQVVGYRRTLETHPRDRWSREGLAACYLALNQPQEAMRVLELERIDKPDAYRLVSLGRAFAGSGDLPGATEFYRKALTVDDGFPLGWQGLGESLGAAGQWQEALAAHEQAARLAPHWVSAHLGVALAALRLGKPAAAGKACRRAAELTPEDPQPWLTWADALVRQGNVDDALSRLETAYQSAPYLHPPPVLLAVLLQQQGESTRARQLLREAARKFPDHPVPDFFLGQMAARDQDWDRARQHLTVAADKSLPGNWPASHRKRFHILLHGERFQLAQQLRDLDLARSAVAGWLAADPDNEKLQQMAKDLERESP